MIEQASRTYCPQPGTSRQRRAGFFINLSSECTGPTQRAEEKGRRLR